MNSRARSLSSSLLQGTSSFRVFVSLQGRRPWRPTSTPRLDVCLSVDRFALVKLGKKERPRKLLKNLCCSLILILYLSRSFLEWTSAVLIIIAMFFISASVAGRDFRIRKYNRLCKTTLVRFKMSCSFSWQLLFLKRTSPSVVGLARPRSPSCEKLHVGLSRKFYLLMRAFAAVPDAVMSD